MKKSFLLAACAAAVMLAFTACNQNGSNPQYSTSRYDGIWVSDSIEDGNGDLYPHQLMWEIINSKQILLHGQEVAALNWPQDDHWVYITTKSGEEITLEVMGGDEDDQRAGFYVMEGGPALGVPDDALLYMYRLPKPEGADLPLTEANILGQWRSTYEINASYDASGKRVDETRFYHGYSIWTIRANGVASSYSAPYTYDGFWDIKNGKLAIANGAKPATLRDDLYYSVELKSNYMHLTRSVYTQEGKLSSTNEQFFYKLK